MATGYEKINAIKSKLKVKQTVNGLATGFGGRLRAGRGSRAQGRARLFAAGE